MTVKEIVIEYLKAHGYDGLVNPGECGCELADLIPCGNENIELCDAAHKIFCGPADCDDCNGLCGGFEDAEILKEKPWRMEAIAEGKYE